MLTARLAAKPLFRAGGYFFFALGALGAALPLLPTTGPWILAVWLLWKGEDPLARRLLDHPRFGNALKDWFEGGRICRMGKMAASAGMAAALVILHTAGTPPLALLAVGITLGAVSAWLWSRPLPEKRTL
jgi:uncharacterized membrane protein YbaN (DUF454 family)